MATAKKSPAKKPARTSVKAAAATKKVTKNASAKAKTTAKKATPAPVKSTVSKTRVLTPLERLRSVHILSALSYALFAVLTAYFVGNAGAQVYLSMQARNGFSSESAVDLAPASEVLFTLEYRYILIAILLTSALGSLLLATKLRRRYETTVGYGVSGLRWILLGITSALTIEFVSLLAGVRDIMTLKTSAALIFATTLLSWLAERENAGAGNRKWLAFGVSLFTGAAAWLPVFGSLVGTSLLAEERFGWHVYALVAATLAGFTGFALNQYLHLKKSNLEYTYIEQRYVRIDQALKFVIVLIVFSALAS